MFRFRTAAVLAALTLSLWACTASAQEERSYSYDSIEVEIVVNGDSTLSVSEEHAYDFKGEYHQGWRSIPHKGLGAISVIGVKDEAGNPLEYSDDRLDKEDPASWGKYTTFKDGGETVIEWYYDAKDEIRTWTLEYKAYGAIGFYDEVDEVYWNLFTDYEVPVRSAIARAALPPGIGEGETIRVASYRTHPNELDEYFQNDRGEIEFHFVDVAPGEDVTVAVGWPKGIVSEADFWMWWLMQHAWNIILVVGSVTLLIVALIRWYVLERRPYKAKTVIAEYAPPANITPAMAGMIAYERFSAKTWPATIIDLAIRGYLTIAESKPTFWQRFIASKEYVLTRTDKADGLEEYEQDLLSLLFKNSGTLSLLSIRSSLEKQNEMHIGMKQIEKKFRHEMSDDHKHLYDVSLKPKKFLAVAGVLVPVIIFVVAVLLKSDGPFDIVAIVFSVTLVAFALSTWHGPRLSEQGNEAKRDVMGFKEYLRVAERYRMQNLTPDLFEKYLPYAMIFGIEKKWAEHFKDINVPSPSWYAGSYAGGISGANASAVSSFSPSAFSASFASSFSSAFASAGGGGSSGGGSAGGGSGGGGGGAS